MSRVPHLPQILQGPLAARPPAAQTPEWVWYFAWDDDGGAFYRATSNGWVKATPSVEPSAWQDASLAHGWSLAAGVPLQFRRNGTVVEMRGGAKWVAGSFPSLVATLPLGYRPAGELRVPIVAGQGLAYLSIAADGAITVHAPLTPQTDTDQSIYLDCVRFPLPA